jgi:hypothetical protein
LMRKQPNYTCMLKNLQKRYCIWTWDTLWVLVFGFFFYYVTPLMRKLQNNIWGTFGGWGTNTKIIKSETSLHFNLEVLFFFNFIYLFIFYFIVYFILFIYKHFFFHLLTFYFYSYLYSFYFLFSILSLSHWCLFSLLISTLSLPVYIFEILLFISFFCFFLLDYLFFPFALTSLLSIPYHLSILNITTAITIRQKILNCTQYRDNNNTKGMMGRQKKQGNQFPHAKN